MSKIPFNPEKELSIIGYYESASGGKTPYFDTPILPKDNMKMLFEGKTPLWIPTMQDLLSVSPLCIPDNPARGFAFDTRLLTDDEKGGLDMFGIEWEYVPVTGGSTVRPGQPLFEDANEWKEKLAGRIPDPYTWGWEENYERIKGLVDDRRMKRSVILSGFFERLISFMNFSNALLALIDDEQKDAVHEIFDMLCGVYQKMIDKMIDALHVDMIEIHDDWGSQRAPLFSADTIREMILPYLKRTIDYAHKRGIYVSLHSCGKNETLVPCMIEAGVDMWCPQAINDFDYLVENYGKQIVIGVNPDVLPAGLTDDEIKEVARKFVAKYADNPRIFLFKSPSRHNKPEYVTYFNEVYCESRRVLAEKE